MKYPPPSNIVIIDGESYKFKEYNGRLWTTENFRNNIPSNYDVSPHGRLYKYSDSISVIESKLLDGWRLPTKQDFDDLISFLGTSNPSDWISEDFGGTNANEFNLALTGYINQNGVLTNSNVRGYIWTTSVYQGNTDYRYNFYCGSTGIGTDDYGTAASGYATKLSVRICKDLT